jgi:hypothetical protein
VSRDVAEGPRPTRSPGEHDAGVPGRSWWLVGSVCGGASASRTSVLRAGECLAVLSLLHPYIDRGLSQPLGPPPEPEDVYAPPPPRYELKAALPPPPGQPPRFEDVV